MIIIIIIILATVWYTFALCIIVPVMKFGKLPFNKQYKFKDGYIYILYIKNLHTK